MVHGNARRSDRSACQAVLLHQHCMLGRSCSCCGNMVPSTSAVQAVLALLELSPPASRRQD